MLAEMKKEPKSRDYFNRLVGELNFATYGKDLLELNSLVYKLELKSTSCHQATTALNTDGSSSHGFSKPSTRNIILSEFCSLFISKYMSLDI